MSRRLRLGLFRPRCRAAHRLTRPSGLRPLPRRLRPAARPHRAQAAPRHRHRHRPELRHPGVRHAGRGVHPVRVGGRCRPVRGRAWIHQGCPVHVLGRTAAPVRNDRRVRPPRAGEGDPVRRRADGDRCPAARRGSAVHSVRRQVAGRRRLLADGLRVAGGRVRDRLGADRRRRAAGYWQGVPRIGPLRGSGSEPGPCGRGAGRRGARPPASTRP